MAGQVGLTCSLRDFDYGIDVTLHQVTVRTNPKTGRKRYVESGAALDVQVKSTTSAIVGDREVRYDLAVEAYDDLRDLRVSTPRILVLHVQPKDEHERLELSETGLTLGGTCYWLSLRGYPEVPNESTVRICVPRSNVLSEGSLREIVQRVSAGESS